MSIVLNGATGITAPDIDVTAQTTVAAFDAGITLGGSADVLGVYEEGTWTPSVSSGTYSPSYATYTKVGDSVFVSMEIVLTGTRGAETFTISGLPFLSANFTAVAFYCGSYASEGTEQVMAYFRGGAADIRFNDFGSDVAGTQFGNNYFNVSGWYRV